MTNTSLLIENHTDGVAVVTINRPEAHNAFDRVTTQLFAEAVEQLAHDDTLRVLVIAGAGKKAFCSGGDLNELDSGDGLAVISLLADTLLKVERLPVPVIAAINGYALGGGAEIALACDLRIVDAKARFGFVQGRMGLIPGLGGGQRLLRLVGYARALEYLLTARTLDVDELKALTLANNVVDEGTALEHALTLAQRIAQNPPELIRAQKALLQAGLHRPYDEALAIERELFPPLWASDTHWQAVDAFLSKKK